MSISTYFYEPFHEPVLSLSEFNRLFDAAWDARTPSSSRELSQKDESTTGASGLMRPRMDLHESKTSDKMTATFELPGMKKEDVNIAVHQNRLIVSGQSTVSEESDKEGYVVRERRSGKFSRTLPLPSGIKPESIKASMDNGVLTVNFPKSHPDQEPKKITVS